MIVNMRSNDVFLGVPYDVFSFTMLQEYIAMRTGFQLGSYFHNAGSFHLYERHYNAATIKEKYISTYIMDKMAFDIPEIYTLKIIYDDIETIDLDMATKRLSPYLANFAWAAKAFVKRKDYKEALYAYKKITDFTIKRIMIPWIKKGE
jgi:hypothetical protein